MFGDTVNQSNPTPPVLPDPLPTPPQYAAGTSNKPQGSGNQYKPMGGTLLTDPSGPAMPTNTTKKSLLGQ